MEFIQTERTDSMHVRSFELVELQSPTNAMRAQHANFHARKSCFAFAEMTRCRKLKSPAILSRGFSHS
jgi:hypothetical protein